MRLIVKNLTKHYGDFKALANFSYSFVPGICGILGQNGAGKSTLFKLLTDSIPRDTEAPGKILWKEDGEKPKEIRKLGKDYRAIIGYMPQEQGFYEDMTARSFLMYMADLKGLPLAGAGRRKTGERIGELLEVVHLQDAAEQRIGTFSGGMRQRLLLAQALLNDPKLLILDEPTAGLDPAERASFRDYLKGLAGEKIILFSTHVVSDVEHTADTILIVQQGKLVRAGSPAELTAAAQEEQPGVRTLEDAFLWYIGK
ncbi:MAG: ATP-binding cassette domain-containing protein [Lachnospiraceae bacterium]|nr:ATP-binding cassette domain-containing protein [Lachnospiraceae bacterium]